MPDTLSKALAKPAAGREQQVYDLILQGLSNKEVAARLGITVHTVRRHAGRIMRVHSCANRFELLAALLRQTRSAG